MYLAWWLWDVQTCNTGGRRSRLVPWVRGLRVWRHLRDYFPIRLVKTADLDPKDILPLRIGSTDTNDQTPGERAYAECPVKAKSHIATQCFKDKQA